MPGLIGPKGFGISLPSTNLGPAVSREAISVAEGEGPPRLQTAMTTLMTAALPASAAAPIRSSIAASSDRPAGLTDADTARITATIAAAGTEATRRLYALAWGQWERWCAARGIPALPGDPLALCAYLTERAQASRAMGTLGMACTAIRHVHRMAGADDPVAADAVRQVRRGLRRTPAGQSTPPWPTPLDTLEPWDI